MYFESNPSSTPVYKTNLQPGLNGALFVIAITDWFNK